MGWNDAYSDQSILDIGVQLCNALYQRENFFGTTHQADWTWPMQFSNMASDALDDGTTAADGDDARHSGTGWVYRWNAGAGAWQLPSISREPTPSDPFHASTLHPVYIPGQDPDIREYIRDMFNLPGWITTLAGVGAWEPSADLEGEDDTYPAAHVMLDADAVGVEAGYADGSWTYYAPKQFATTASTTYVDGATAANGDTARCLADGYCYTRTAGAWTSPSLSVEPGQQSSSTLTTWAWAFLKASMFEKGRDMLNVLDRYIDAANPYSVAAGTGAANAGYQVTNGDWTAAKAEVASDWGSETFTEVASYTYAGHSLSPDGVGDAKALAGRSAYFFAPTSTDIECQVDFFALATAEIITSYGVTTQTWDANGADVLEDVYHQWSTVSSGAPSFSTPLVSSVLGNITFPVWCADPSSNADPLLYNSRGYRVAKVTKLCRATGFTQHP